MAKEKEILTKDIRDEVADYLKNEDRNLGWLSRKSGIPYGTLYYSIVRRQFTISEKNIKKINDALETNFSK